MDNISTLQIAGYIIVSFALLMYILLDGFDLGIAILLPILGKNRTQKSELMNSIFPFWDGNEVWLVTAGALLFAIFPQSFGILLGGLAPIVLIAVFCLMLRAASFEFLYHTKKNHLLWELMIAGTSLIIGVILTLSIAALLFGVIIDGSTVKLSSNLLSLGPISFVLLSIFAVLCQGTSYAAKIESVSSFASYLTKALSILVLSSTLIFVLDTFIHKTAVALPILWWLGIVIIVIGAIGLILSASKNAQRLLVLSSIVIVGIWIMTLALQFPYITKTISGTPMTIYNSSSSLGALKFIVPFSFFWTIIILALTMFVYKVFKNPVIKTGVKQSETVSTM